MKRTLIIVILFIVIIGMAFGIMKYLSAQKELPVMNRPPEIVRYVKTTEVLYDDIITEVSGKGRVVAIASVDVVSEGSGKILQGDVPLRNGQSFKKGEVLFSIYKDEVELTLKARKSNFLNALANLLPDVKIDYPENYDEVLGFFKAIDVDKDLPQLPKFQSEQLKMFMASRNVLAEFYSIQKDELALKRYVVFAPFDGTYNTVNMEVGAYASMGTRIAKAIQTDVVEVEVAVDAEYSSFIKLGDVVFLEGNDTWKGKVARISGYIDEGTQSRLVYVKVDKHTNMPLPGQYLNAVFTGKELKGVMEVPRNAVFNYNEIYTIVDGRLKKSELNVLKRNENTLIFNGLDEGITIVVQPLIGVNDGSKVSRLKDAPKKVQGEKGKQTPKVKAQ